MFYFGSCQCLINYVQQSDYICTALSTTDDVCPVANMRFWSITAVNYNCSYEEATESHILYLRYIPFYDKLTKCLNFTLYSTNNSNYKIPFTISQDPLFNFFKIQFKTIDMENFFLCTITTSVLISYRCRFTFESYYQGLLLTYSFFVYEFQLNRITQDTLSFYSSPILIKISDCCCQTANNEGYCTDTSVYKSRADMCTDETCSIYENKTNFNYTQKLYIQHSIVNSTLNQYTLNVTDLTFSCDGVFTKMIIEKQKNLPGKTIIQTSSSLTGQCIINIRSTIIPYVSTTSRRALVHHNSYTSWRALENQSSNNGDASERYLIGLQVDKNINITLKNSLQLTNSEENSSSIIIIVIPVVFGGIVIVLVGLFIWRKIKGKKGNTTTYDGVPVTA